MTYKKGNIGEWSEIYALLKVLGDETLFAGNESLERLEDVVYPVLKILRSESTGDFEYMLNQKVVFITNNGEELLNLPVKVFTENAKRTLQKILENKKQKNTTFSIPETEDFMNEIHCKSLKASSSQKTDITIMIHDARTNQQPALGFSIKSQLGGASTLLNAGKTTNLKYKINGLDKKNIQTINSIKNPKKILKRIKEIENLGGKFEFIKIVNDTFSNNLTLIDSLLPKIISEMVLTYYTSKLSSLPDLVEDLENKNTLRFDNSNKHKFYTYKIKKMLTDIALGLTPSKVWNGKYDATGGYLVIKDDGDILCYHLYNKNEFEDYLLSNTKLETASTKKYLFSEIYEEEDNLFFNLNLQIRFIK